jgi:4-diphosphocytidyl-2-C-methyl-D-erythritol kinase
MMPRHAHARANAKLNLRLAILAREASGHHTVETVMHKIVLTDDVDVALAPPGTRTVTADAECGPAEHNLARRAADAFLNATDWDTGYTIHLTKRIPSGGGLGGGSADAGATLRALNALAPTPLSHDALLTVATPLGADVPFLTSDAPMALAWGRGERMLALDPLPERHVVLIVPKFRVATADAYGWLARNRESAGTILRAGELRHWHLANWAELAHWWGNDFEPVIAARHPETIDIISALRHAGAALAGMTGSGSTLFGIFDVLPDVDALRQHTGSEVIVTKTASGIDAVSVRN